jgi:hypothetical protein
MSVLYILLQIYIFSFFAFDNQHLTCSMSIAELRNDHKDVTSKIEKNLEVLHSAKLSMSQRSTSRQSGMPSTLSCRIKLSSLEVVSQPVRSLAIFYVCKYLDWEHENNAFIQFV